jgi:hypothetical protein|tara:strand:+ start:358 stop:1239 length:882 start_codon:yes stop_codon:yes gene_type:complete
MKKLILFSIVSSILLVLSNCGPKGHHMKKHGGPGGKSEYRLLTKEDIKVSGEYSIEVNNGTELQYQEAAEYSGKLKEIQMKTKGLWPRMAKGEVYNVSGNKLKVTEDEDYLYFETNNLPDHKLTRTNPNEAKSKNYYFTIPKSPKFRDEPYKITKKTQEIGVALNGIIIAAPYDSQDKIAPYNRIVDECSSHSDPQGMYHYHFAPLCLKNSNGESIGVNPQNQIGWSFDGFKIYGLADRKKHMPIIDECNGHSHGEEYHYHATIDFPFFMGCFKGEPYYKNFEQKKRGKKKRK